MSKNILYCILLGAWAGLSTVPAPLYAEATMYYHPSNGTPLQWETDSNGKATIHYIVDAGGLGRLTHTQALQLLQAAMEVWEAAANIEFVFDGTTDQAITADNYQDYLVVDETICTDNCTDLEDAENSIQFDRTSIIGFDNTDREILDDADGLAGSGNSFGQTNITSISGTNADPGFITSAQIIFDGKSIDGVTGDGATELTVNKYAAIMIHELGHFIGLDHTSVNQTLNQAITAGEINESNYAKFVPTMEANRVLHQDLATLNPDDIAAAQALYPFSDSPTTTVSGNITDSNDSDFRGAQMELRSTDDPLCEVYSFISGKQCTPLYVNGGDILSSLSGSRCSSTSTNTGQFFLRAIPSGTYVLSAQEVIDDYKGGVIHPFSTEFPISELIGDAEFYNENDLTSEDYNYRTSLIIDGTTDLSDLTLILSSSTADGDGSENLIPIDFFSTTNGFGDSLTAATSRCQPNTVDYAALIGIEELVDDDSNDDSTDNNGSSETSSTGGCSLVRE